MRYKQQYSQDDSIDGAMDGRRVSVVALSATLATSALMTLTPSSAIPGYSIAWKVSGATSFANAIVVLKFSTASGSGDLISLGKSTIGPYGNDQGTFTVPQESAGGYYVNLYDSTSNALIASASFTVLSTNASITTSTPSVAVGGTLKFTGTGFAPNSAVTITDVSLNTTLTLPGPFTTDSTGAFSGSFIATSNILGANTLTATDASGNKASSSFLVTAATAPSVSPDAAAYPPSSVVTLTCAGFPASTTVYALNSTTILGSATSDSTGAAIIKFTSPANPTPGILDIIVSTNSTNPTNVLYASTSIYLTNPVLTITVSSFAVGDFINWSGSGYLPNSQIQAIDKISGVTINVTTTPIPKTDVNGNVTANFQADSNMIGSDILTISDVIGSSASVDFKVGVSAMAAQFPWLYVGIGGVVIVVILALLGVFS